MGWVGRPWHRLLREAVAAPSLEVSKTRLDGALSNLVYIPRRKCLLCVFQTLWDSHRASQGLLIITDKDCWYQHARRKNKM